MHLEAGFERFFERHGTADIVFCRGVVLHQPDPFGFLRQLLGIAREALVLRSRTRDRGATVLDADRSCQFHYDRHCVPYIVINTQELLDALAADASVRRIVVSRRYEVQGGHNFRFLPKEPYCSAAGGAETAVLAVKAKGPRRGAPAVEFDDQPDGPAWNLLERAILRFLLSPIAI